MAGSGSGFCLFLCNLHVLFALLPPHQTTASNFYLRMFKHHFRCASSDFGIRFDAPEKMFIVHAGLRDMPPGTLYVVKLRDSDANIAVWRDDDIFRDLKTAYSVFSEHVEERSIRDATGRISGTDHWGYLQSGERWRYVRFSSGDAAGYKPTPPKQAKLLDQVVNSACFSRDEPSD
jgi:hypothetical protein